MTTHPWRGSDKYSGMEASCVFLKCVSIPLWCDHFQKDVEAVPFQNCSQNITFLHSVHARSSSNTASNNCWGSFMMQVSVPQEQVWSHWHNLHKLHCSLPMVINSGDNLLLKAGCAFYKSPEKHRVCVAFEILNQACNILWRQIMAFCISYCVKERKGRSF